MKTEITEILGTFYDPAFGETRYNVRYNDGSEDDVRNPLTAQPSASKQVWSAYCAKMWREIREEIRAGHRIHAYFGIHDEHNPPGPC